MTPPKLPKLPVGFLVNATSHDMRHKWTAYTAEEMEAYAEQYGRLCAEAERAAIIELVPGGYSVDPQWVCDAIRARGTR